MKAGQVTRLRVNPKDCQSVLDLLDRIGVPYQNLSFSQCTSIALASLLETARVHKTLPEPDPFQYLNRMSPFLGHGTSMQRKRLAAANALGSIGETFQAPTLISTDQIPTEAMRAQPEAMSLDMRQARTRLNELVSKKEMIDDGVPGLTWSASDDAEYWELYKVVYPEG